MKKMEGDVDKKTKKKTRENPLKRSRKEINFKQQIKCSKMLFMCPINMASKCCKQRFFGVEITNDSEAPILFGGTII